MIPTAEEFFKSQIPKYESVSEFMTDGDIFHNAREFAKLCVEDALKEAAGKAILNHKVNVDIKDIPSGFHLVATKDSILKAYPLTNIK